MKLSKSTLTAISLIIAFTATYTLTSASLNPAHAAPKSNTDAQGYTTLFNGENFDGWDQRGGKANYTIKDNQIIGTTKRGTPNSFLTTEKHYDNFILELEYIVDPKLNSGIQIRSNSNPAYGNGRVHGYQIEIDPSKRAWSAGLYEEGRRGWLNNLKDNPKAQAAFKQNKWNHYKIKCVGNKTQTWINGVPAANYTDTNKIMYKTGFIGLQVHSHSTAGLQVKWKNIKIKEIK